MFIKHLPSNMQEQSKAKHVNAFEGKGLTNFHPKILKELEQKTTGLVTRIVNKSVESNW